MYNDGNVVSVFDLHHKLKCPSAKFEWKDAPTDYQLRHEDVVCEGELQEFDAMSSGLRSAKFYAATPRELLRFPVCTLLTCSQGSDFTSPEAILPLPLPRMELFKDRANWKFGFSLTAHEVTMRFGAETKEDAQKWYNALKKRCKTVLLHISRDFDIGKMLGRGAYTKVNLATHNETRTPYAIKSVLKSKLVESSTRIVRFSA